MQFLIDTSSAPAIKGTLYLHSSSPSAGWITFRLSEFHFFLGINNGTTFLVQRLDLRSFGRTELPFVGSSFLGRVLAGPQAILSPGTCHWGTDKHRCQDHSWVFRWVFDSPDLLPRANRYTARMGLRCVHRIAFLRANLQLFTSASAVPFWWGAAGVKDFHCTPLSTQYSRNILLPVS